MRPAEMRTPDDLENCKQHLRVDLSEIEKTFELRTLPSDPYLAVGRIVEIFGTKAFQNFEKDFFWIFDQMHGRYP